MASAREIFSLSGPSHLTVIDWNSAHHRRSIAASLVRGASILERDRQQNCRGHNRRLAPPWWEFFNFQLFRVLEDPDDSSFFGCVYEPKIPYPYFNYASHQNPPRYVITFRGTVTKPDTWLQDIKLDLRCISNSLHHSSRFRLGLRTVQDIVAEVGAANIWLAGHSLGSAIALLIGRNMVKMGHHIETYLFNPPFISPPLERIKNEKLRQGVRDAGSFITAFLAAAVNRNRQRPEQDDHFAVLSGWIPYLFVNAADPICSEYVGYFEHREKMMAVGSGELGRLAGQNSILSIISAAWGNDSEAFHLLPSAYLTTNLSPSQEFRQDHGIQQWWRPDVQLTCKLHKFIG